MKHILSSMPFQIAYFLHALRFLPDFLQCCATILERERERARVSVDKKDGKAKKLILRLHFQRLRIKSYVLSRRIKVKVVIAKTSQIVNANAIIRTGT
jgi:hypothetical protein